MSSRLLWNQMLAANLLLEIFVICMDCLLCRLHRVMTHGLVLGAVVGAMSEGLPLLGRKQVALDMLPARRRVHKGGKLMGCGLAPFWGVKLSLVAAVLILLLFGQAEAEGEAAHAPCGWGLFRGGLSRVCQPQQGPHEGLATRQALEGSQGASDPRPAALLGQQQLGACLVQDGLTMAGRPLS